MPKFQQIRGRGSGRKINDGRNRPPQVSPYRSFTTATRAECVQNQTRLSEHTKTNDVIRNIPGFSYDPVKKKYFKLLPGAPGQPERLIQHQAKELDKIVEKERLCNGIIHSRKRLNSNHKISELLYKRQLPCSSYSTRIKRKIKEQRICCRLANTQPNFSFEVIDSTFTDLNFSGSQFLEVSDDGRSLIGCWSPSNNKFSSVSRVLSHSISVDLHEAQAECVKFDVFSSKSRLLWDKQEQSFNTYGLRFEEMGNGQLIQNTLVDMALAPVDSDVTCIVYATAKPMYIQQRSRSGLVNRLITNCFVGLTPVEFNLSQDGRQNRSEPPYNFGKNIDDEVWSLSFCSAQMKICVGMERCALISDVLYQRNFKVSSGSRNVIASGFSKSGTNLLLGRRNANMTKLDLRLRTDHVCGEFFDSHSVCSIKQMSIRENLVLTQSFQGKLNLWDVRNMEQPVFVLAGHHNTSHKLPWTIDPNEQFIFAVGEDCIIRGWSLNEEGRLLCSLPAIPNPVIDNNADYPRIVYSECWGGVYGNTGLAVAQDGKINFYELKSF